MKISQLKVDALFGLYDYSIDFKHDEEDLTVITSPNGFGKTTLLRIINSLNPQRLYNLYLLKFKQLCFCFDDGSELVAKETDAKTGQKGGGDTIKDVRRGLSLVWSRNKKEICRFDYSPETLNDAKSIAYRRFLSKKHYILDDVEAKDEFFVDGEGGEIFNYELARTQKQEQFFLQLATIQTDFIGANRIYYPIKRDRIRRNSYETPILQVVSELKQSLSEAVTEFQDNFQRLDSKFIDMLLEDKGHKISEDDYNKRAALLSEKIDELVQFGLTNKQKLPSYDSDKSQILDAYLLLMEEKLEYFKDLLPKVRLFSKNVQQKRFADKTIRVSPQHGLRIESDNGDILRADMLSTGEQNQLVLLYDLIFKTPKGSILLIDEPESSLHVAWQNDFVDDMQNIARQKGLQIVIATHSPIIVSNTPDNQVFDLFYLQNKNNA